MSEVDATDAADSPAPPGLPEQALAERALEVVLRPLARLMIDHGLQLGSMVELLKKALVDESQNAYALEGKGSTDSRIAVLTGVHRKDVKRLRDEPRARTADIPVATQVVSRWISEARYLSADRTPRRLARTPRMGSAGEPDFTTLVSEVSKDVGARAILDELQRLGVVDIADDGFVSLRATSFVPQQGLEDAFLFLAHNLQAHLATAVHNLAPHRREPLMLEQSAFSLDLSPAQANELHRLARRLWTDDLQEFLQATTVAEQRSQDIPGPRHRVRFGVYFHDELRSDGEAADPPMDETTRKPSKKGKRQP